MKQLFSEMMSTLFKTQFNDTEKIWSGVKSSIQIAKDQNFGEIILNNLADGDSERVMQIDGDTGESWTMSEVRRRTIRCAQNLQKLGCTPDHRIVIIARNNHNLTPLLFAAFCIGTPINPLDVFQDGKADIIQRLEPSLIFCDTDVAEWVQNTIADIKLSAQVFTVNGRVDGFKDIESLMCATGCEDGFVCSKIKDSHSHAAILLSSSGSTGPSKIICISHAMLALIEVPKLPLVTFSFSSLYWASGLTVLLHSAFKYTRIFTSISFCADKFFDLVEKYKVQVFITQPSYFNACLKSERCKTANFSSLLLCLLGGGILPFSVVRRFATLMPQCYLLNSYGLTETLIGLSTGMHEDLIKYPNVVGRLSPGVQMKIVNVTTGMKCGLDEAGEICVKTPIPLMGYFRDAEANRVAFDCDGYFMTGDVGYLDCAGRLFVNGRNKDMFKVRNNVIWPSELEDILQKYEAIRNVCVVGVFDEETATDLAAAVVETNDGYTITKEEVYKLISDELTRYKWLDGGVYFLTEMPLTPSGKVRRPKVEEMAHKFYESKK